VLSHFHGKYLPHSHLNDTF